MNSTLKWLAAVLGLAAVGFGIYWFTIGRFKKIEAKGFVPEITGTTSRAAVPVPEVTFTNVTEKAGIKFNHFTGATGQKLLPETMGGGVAVIDFDNDGKPDLFFTNGCPWPGHPSPEKSPCLALYRNKGDGTFEDVTKAMGLEITMYAMGCCVGDYDNDGFPDLFVSGVGGDRLFHNDGGKKFTEVTAKAKVGGEGGWQNNFSAPMFLKTTLPIPFGSSATFVDYDGDGKLDLFVCRYVTWSPAIDLGIKSTLTGTGRTYQQPTSLEGNFCALYRNKGDGTFEDVSESAGIKVTEPEGTDANSKQRPVGKSLGVILCDPDHDGWPDLVVANDTVRNFFFHNVPDGKGGRKFVERGKECGIAYAEGSARGASGAMGIDAGYFRPDTEGIVVANFANEATALFVLYNPKRLMFSDNSNAVNLYGPSRGPLKFGAFFFDYDLDGRLDLLTCNGHIDPDIHKIQSNQTYKQPAQLFWNTGENARTFEPVTEKASGPDLFKPIVGRGSAYLDFDGDGDLDVVLVENGGPAMLLRNDQKRGNHFIRLTLEGDGVTSNRSAIGAEVIVEAGGKKFIRSVAGARGYLSQSEFAVTVGLEKIDTIEKVTVRWPGKTNATQVWTNLKIDSRYVLQQGKTEAIRQP